MALREIEKENKVFCEYPGGIYKPIYKTEIDGKRFAVQIILIENDKILLVEATKQRKIDIPGGAIKKGETLEKALKREVWEETGLIVEPINLLGIVESCFYYEEKDRIYHNIRLHYSAKRVGGEIKPQGNQIDTFDAKFYSIDELRNNKSKYRIFDVAWEALENFVFNKI